MSKQNLCVYDLLFTKPVSNYNFYNNELKFTEWLTQIQSYSVGGGDYFNDYPTRAFSTVVWYVKTEYGFVFYLSCHLTGGRNFLKSASNGLIFNIDLVHRIIRPTVKKLAQSDCPFNS